MMYLHWMSNFQPSSSTSDGDMWLYALHDKYFPASVRLRTIDNVLVVRLPSLDVYRREVKREKNQIKFPFFSKVLLLLLMYFSIHFSSTSAVFIYLPPHSVNNASSLMSRAMYTWAARAGGVEDCFDDNRLGEGEKRLMWRGTGNKKYFFQAFVMKWVKRKRKLFELIINQFFASPDMLHFQCMVELRRFSTIQEWGHT